MSDDIFDQLVDDVLAEEDEKESPAADEPEADAAPKSEPSTTSAADDEVDPTKSHFEITTDEPKPAAKPSPSPEAKQPEPKPKAKPEGTADESSAAPPAKAAAVPEPVEDDHADAADSGIDEGAGGGKTPALPLSTTMAFEHPQYEIAKTLSVISSRRVVHIGGGTATEGRSASGEKLLIAIEHDLKHELRLQAAKRGAHAVVGLTVAIGPLADGLVYGHASGTPIKLKKRGD